MRLSEFDYDLPPDRIAQVPAARRDGSRLLALDRSTGAARHLAFRDLPDALRPGDLLVVNDTRVRPARLRGTKETGGRIEMLLLEPGDGDGVWRCLLDASRPPARGSRLVFPEGLVATVGERSEASWTVSLEAEEGSVIAAVERAGEVPLPPYIRRSEKDPRAAEDRERYQTMFARETGSAAAPTAGLHFTPEVVDALERKGIALATVTLHVGIGTFLPIRTEDLDGHRMHEEAFRDPDATASAISRTRRQGGRVVAVGTTTVRTLETRARNDGSVAPGEGRSDLFIRPGHRFRAVDGMLTNFHLPRSTLLVLVCAFAGRERVLAAYREAIERGYRFYSYGDAMLVADP